MYTLSCAKAFNKFLKFFGTSVMLAMSTTREENGEFCVTVAAVTRTDGILS